MQITCVQNSFVYPLSPNSPKTNKTNALFSPALLSFARFLSLSLSFTHSLSRSFFFISFPFFFVWLLMSSLSLTFFATTAPRVLVPSSSSNPKLSPPSYSFSATTARWHSTAVSFRSGARRTSATCPCASFSSFNVRAMAKMVQDRESAVSSSSASDEQNKKMLNIEVNHSRTFLDVRSEQGLVWFGFAL